MQKEMLRRTFLKIGAGAGAATLLGGAALIDGRDIEPSRPVVRNYDLPTSKLPVGYPALRVLIFADPHVGCPSMTLARLGEMVAAANTLRPDIILVAGDMYLDSN